MSPKQLEAPRCASFIGFPALSAVVLTFVLAGMSFGTPIVNGTGLATPAVTITFSEFSFAPNTTITNQFSSLGVSFTPQLFYDTPDTLYANIVGDRLQNYYPCCSNFSILFSNIQSAVDFNIVTQPGTTTFTAKLGGVTQESFSTATDLLSTPNFFGFEGISLDEVVISVSSVNGAMQLDNLQLSDATNVPEPGSGWLLLFGAVPVALRWFRRAR